MPAAASFTSARTGWARAIHEIRDAFGTEDLEDARESLRYWRSRHARLPRYRLAQRREARTMIVRWEQRVRRAEIDHFGAGPVARVMAALHAGGSAAAGRALTRASARFVTRLVPGRVVLAAFALAGGLALFGLGLCAVALSSVL